MEWDRLLSATRIRELFGGSDSLKSPDDRRSPFERDYGRTIFSTPVRRLQDKAVFPLVQRDSVRTRLTHSIEVSSVARSLGAMVAKWLVDNHELPNDLAPAVEVIAATCGILHDLGNPPFGHAGEQAISEWCKKIADVETRLGFKPQCVQDFLQWNGNAQTLRLIGRLQVLSDEYGLNLTCATLSAACKYIAPSHGIDKNRHDWSKAGYFFSENSLIQKVREATGTGAARHPLTFLVEAGDDIVYSAVDLEDGIKKRLLTWDRLENELLQKNGACEHTSKALKLARDKIGNAMRGFARDDALVQAFRTYAIGAVVPSVFEEFKKNYKRIIAGDYHDELTVVCSAAALVRSCKEIAHDVVYQSDEVLRVELMGRRVIQDLLSVFWEGAASAGTLPKGKSFAEKTYSLLSNNYRQVFEDVLSRKPSGNDTDAAPEEYYRLQLVCDYVAGMTDTFATNLHKELTNA